VNRLGSESSPYLRQHADNPVDWYPWGDEAFAEARARDCPVLLSVGYSSCHWCHVMAHESFEDPETAAVMNEHFVCVKVDREERPDVDAIYMEATVATTGHGGWPMTVFLTPEGEPFFCGTYFPKVRRGGMPSFVEVCQAVQDAWQHRRGELHQSAARLTEHLRRDPDLGRVRTDLHPALLATAERSLLESYDPTWGGFGRAPKFPQSMAIDLLLRRARQPGSDAARAAALHTLDAMAAGGIWDHLGGGFARYSVDERWLVPHFEKMLYDQALLIRPYLHAHQLTGRAEDREIVESTIDYVLTVLRQPEGGFASAEDADSEGVEGRFYVWAYDELHPDLAEWYGATPEGNFEGANILHRPIGSFSRPGHIEELRREWFDRRAQRVRPGLDDKCLTEWNALMLASLAEAAAALDRPDWADAAVANADFLRSHLLVDGRWHRSWQRGSGARHLAVAHDHVTLVDAFIRLYELTGDWRWVDDAVEAAEAAVALFWDPERGSFWTTGSDAPPLITRPRDLQDGATPSPQSTAAVALGRLAALTGRDDLARVAETIVRALAAVAARHPLAFAQLLMTVDQFVSGLEEVVIPGERSELVLAVQRAWTPNAVLAWGPPQVGPLWEGREPGFAYVCRNWTCLAPVATPAELVELLG
jgi:uncharacterized protein YyaL (SSP411 family)